MSAMKIKSYQGVRLACIDIPDCVLIFSTVILAFINFFTFLFVMGNDIILHG